MEPFISRGLPLPEFLFRSADRPSHRTGQAQHGGQTERDRFLPVRASSTPTNRNTRHLEQASSSGTAQGMRLASAKHSGRSITLGFRRQGEIFGLDTRPSRADRPVPRRRRTVF